MATELWDKTLDEKLKDHGFAKAYVKVLKAEIRLLETKLVKKVVKAKRKRP